jgi:hypothetical protein
MTNSVLMTELILFVSGYKFYIVFSWTPYKAILFEHSGVYVCVCLRKLILQIYRQMYQAYFFFLQSNIYIPLIY